MSAVDPLILPRPRAMDDIPDDDETLAERSRAGDAAAFETLTARHIDRIYRLAALRAGSPHDAEDLTQEVFLAAHQSLPSFEGRARFTTWLYRIALNRIADHKRRQQRRPKARPLSSAEQIADASLGPARAASFDEEQRRAREAIEALPEVFKRAFLLRVIGGLSYKDIAEILGCAPGTVDSRIARARALLARQLGRP